MSAPTKAIASREPRETTGTRVLPGPPTPPPPDAVRRPDLMWLAWALFPGAGLCLPLRGVIGEWGLIPAGVIVVALVSAIIWSLGGER